MYSYISAKKTLLTAWQRPVRISTIPILLPKQVIPLLVETCREKEPGMAPMSFRNLLATIALLLFSGLVSNYGVATAQAAIADVTSFNAKHHEIGPMIYHDDLSFVYEASWTSFGLSCYRTIDWYSNSMWSANMSHTTHGTSPVNVTG